MAEVTEEDLQKQREKLDALREQIPDAIAEREAREAALSREYQMASMKVEEDRLQAAISLNTEAAKAVDAGAADLLAAASGAVVAPVEPAPVEAPEATADKPAAKGAKE